MSRCRKDSANNHCLTGRKTFITTEAEAREELANLNRTAALIEQEWSNKKRTRRIGPNRPAHHVDGWPEINEAQYAALVAIILDDQNVEDAVAQIARNREPINAARLMGAEPDQLAQFLIQRFGL